MNVLLFVIIILIIIFLVYLYKNYFADRCSNSRKTLLLRDHPRVNGTLLRGKYYKHKPHCETITPTATRVSPNTVMLTKSIEVDKDIDCGSDSDFEDLSDRYNNFVRSRKRAKELGLDGDTNESIFTKSSTEIINDTIDSDSGTYNTLFRTAKAQELKDYIAAQNAESNEYYDPTNIESEINMHHYNDESGERSLLARNEGEATRVVMGEISNRIKESESMTIEGLTNRDMTQIQVVPQALAGGRTPASGTLKNLSYQTTDPMAQMFFASMAARDIEDRKFKAGNSQDSLVDQLYIAAELY